MAKKSRPAITPEAQENKMISLAMDLAEKKIRNGTASSQLITEFVKRGSTKARLEKEIMEEQKDLMRAKREALESAKRIDELYDKAIKAMRHYGGNNEPYEDESYE